MLGIDQRVFAGRVFIGAALALLGSACTVHDDDDGYYEDPAWYPPYNSPPEGPAELATIDADFTLSTELGFGAALHVEYARGGLWTVWSSCDTDDPESPSYGYYCYWDVYVTAHGFVDTVDAYEVEISDYFEIFDDSSFFFHAETGSFSDLLQFTTAPGELVEITAYLDGYEAHTYLMWHGNGVVHAGARSQPLILQPDVP